MTNTLFAWLALTLALAGITLIAVWSRRDTPNRLWVVVMFLLTAPLSYVLLQEPLGYPDPDKLPKGEWRVLGHQIIENVAIFAMLDDGSGEPHLYRLPYTNGQADQMQKAMDAQAGGQASGVKVRTNDQGEYEVHPEPVRASPEKHPETPQIQGEPS